MRLRPFQFLFMMTLGFLAACTQEPKSVPLIQVDGASNEVKTALLVKGSEQSEATLEEIKEQAVKLGVQVEGDVVVRLTGSVESLNQLKVGESAKINVILDEVIGISRPTGDDLAAPDETIHYLAKKDFGLIEFWNEHPTYDGRGVKVAVIDDGVSPLAGGLQTTSEGHRKLLARQWSSTLLDSKLESVADPELYSDFVKSYAQGSFLNVWQGALYEGTLSTMNGMSSIDLNEDGTVSEISLAVVKREEGLLVCVDQNVNRVMDSGECFGTFAQTGEFGFWTSDHKVSVEAEFEPQSAILRLSQGERADDSHGEGTASVLSGHLIGGKFDGVAPGSQLYDYDLSQDSRVVSEASYTIGTFLRALEWLGGEGVEVINISYSLFFVSSKTQGFMREALDQLVQKYRFVVGFSAGNNGPGLGSLNRREIYPEDSLVAGAFVSRELDEYVHGVTGLPPEGRVVYYSSRGPGPDGGRGPLMLSPLSSLTHAEIGDGFQGFSGTSSASPALAGLAAVLISAVKAEGLRVEPSAVVHALRLSAHRLPGVPFVDQGYGLPNALRALELYRTLIQGEAFARVEARVPSAKRPDGTLQRGLFLLDSQVESAQMDFFVGLKGIVVGGVSGEVAGNLLKPVRLEYSKSWISGPSHLWISIGESHLMLKVDVALLRSQRSDRGGEDHGEVSIYDSENGQLIHILPVTVVDDQPTIGVVSQVVELEAQNGVRRHWSVTGGVKGLWVHHEGPLSLLSMMGLNIYDPSGVKVTGVRGGDDFSDVFVNLNGKKGWYQTAYYRSLGSDVLYSLKSTVTPVELEIKSLGLPLNGGGIEITNVGHRIEGWLEAVQIAEPVARGFAKVQDGEFVIEQSVSKAGIYRLAVEPASSGDLSYPYISCFSSFVGVDLNIALKESYQVKLDSDSAGTLRFQCQPFDHVPEMNERPPLFSWTLTRVDAEQEVVYGRKLVRLSSGRTSSAIPWEKEPAVGSEVLLRLKPSFGSGSIELVRLPIY